MCDGRNVGLKTPSEQNQNCLIYVWDLIEGLDHVLNLLPHCLV